jgi:hypothetical protein
VQITNAIYRPTNRKSTAIDKIAKLSLNTRTLLREMTTSDAAGLSLLDVLSLPVRAKSFPARPGNIPCSDRRELPKIGAFSKPWTVLTAAPAKNSLLSGKTIPLECAFPIRHLRR